MRARARSHRPVTCLALTLAWVCTLIPALTREARGAPPLTVEEIFREPHVEGTRPQDAAMSPDEKWVAYGWNAGGLESPLDLWVTPAAGGRARALTTFRRDAQADSLRDAFARTPGPEDSLPGKKLPRYFGEGGVDYRAGGIAWSPDSRRIAFVVRGDLYLAAVGGGLERLTVTRAAESDAAWSPDGHFLAFTRDNAVWALEVDRGRELQLTPAGGDSLHPSALQWSPDGNRLALLGRDERGLPDLLVPNFLGERVGTGHVKEGYPDNGVRVVDVRWLRDPRRKLEAGEPFPVTALRLGAGKHPSITALAWSPDSRHLAITEVTSDMRTRRVLVAAADSAQARAVYTETDSAWAEEFDWVITGQPVLDWSPDNRSLLIATERTGFRQLWRVMLSGGAPLQLTRGDWEVGWARWLPDGRYLVAQTARARTSERQLEVFDTAQGTWRRLATGPGMAVQPAMSGRGRRILYEHSRFDRPADLYSIALEANATPVQLTHSVPAAFDAVDWVVPEVVEFPARDGARLKGLLYRPAGFDPQRRYPAVVFVHGAGILQNVVDGWTFYAPNFKFHTLLAQRGYVVFEVDYRGSLGYGRDFRAGVYMHLGGKDLEDEVAGLDYLDRTGFVDAARVGIYGGSYGGFMALMALFTTPDRWACGAALRAVSDWENYFRGNPWYCVQRLGTPDAHPDAYWRSSPIHFAGNLRRPLLILHGMRDDNVHFQDAAQLTERLIRYGKRFDLMMYPHEPHGFTAAASWIDEYRRIAAFFDQNLRPDGLPPDAGAGAGAAAGAAAGREPR